MAAERRVKEERDKIAIRLDALLRLTIEINKLDADEKLSDAIVARSLKSVGMTPTDIAGILGKRRTDIAKYLYSKKE